MFYGVCNDPEYQQWAQANGIPIEAPMSLDELAKYYGREVIRYQRLAKSIPSGKT